MLCYTLVISLTLSSTYRARKAIEAQRSANGPAPPPNVKIIYYDNRRPTANGKVTTSAVKLTHVEQEAFKKAMAESMWDLFWRKSCQALRHR